MCIPPPPQPERLVMINFVELAKARVRDYLLHKWQAPDNFQWPTKKRTTMGRTINYRLSRDTFRWFDWVVYSSSKDGLFCKVCAMSAKNVHPPWQNPRYAPDLKVSSSNLSGGTYSYPAPSQAVIFKQILLQVLSLFVACFYLTFFIIGT
jgi:hypothetical protein